MERRVLVVIFSCFLVLYLWNVFVLKPTVRPATSPSAAGTPASSTAAANVPATPLAAEAAPAPASQPAGTAVISDTSEREVRVETRDVIAVFTNRGARLKSWRLKRYFDQDKQPQELVVSQFDNHPLPFSLQVADEHRSAAINGALYAVNESPGGTDVTAGPKTLRFEYSSVGPALHVVKEFELSADGYIVSFRASVTGGSTEGQADAQMPYTIVWGPAVGDLGEVSRYAQKPEGLLAQGTNVQRPAAKDFAKQAVYSGDFRYAGVDDNYFMTVALSLAGAKVHYEALSIPPPAGSKDPPHDLVAYSIEPGPTAPVRFFVGPKDFDVLAAVDQDMTRAINFGMFAVIVVPLLRSLKWVHSYIGNYGWSIVILTVLINAILFPLRHKSAVSMRKMQEIQPEVKSIQDRYSKYKATDPARQKMNQELMGLYKDRGVNPASGCVPMLLTMPVFLAMWALLQTSIELRGAPWFGWIHDLSSHDRFYILPILMVATQFWQQRMMPATGTDPTQQKMMMFMPAVMGFIFLWLPAGALIYYIISNVWTAGQQVLTNRLLGPPNVRSIRPAAERRMKRVGGGKSEAAGRDN